MATSKIGKAFAKEPIEEAEDDAEEASGVGDDSESPDAEVLAMKAFEKAKDPKAKAKALKSFLQACGALGYEDDGEEAGMSDVPAGGLSGGGFGF